MGQFDLSKDDQASRPRLPILFLVVDPNQIPETPRYMRHEHEEDDDLTDGKQKHWPTRPHKLLLKCLHENAYFADSKNARQLKESQYTNNSDHPAAASVLLFLWGDQK